VQITSLLSHFHLGINFAIITKSLLNYSVPVMEIPDMKYFCQHHMNQLDTIKYAEYFSHHISFLD
jgi:hypothetical protein